MGKPHYPPTESFCQYVFKALVKRFETDLEFYSPDNSPKRKKSSKSASVVKLLSCSNLCVWANDYVNKGSFEEDQCSLKNYDNGNSDVYFNVNGSDEVPVSREDLQYGKVRETVSSSFRDHVYKKLTERLENEIKLSTKTNKSGSANNSITNNGILLLKSAKYLLQNEEKPDVVIKKRKRVVPNKSDDTSRSEKLKESTVDPEWVLSKSGTEGWRETKRPKVQRLKLVSTLSDGARHCKEIE